MVVEPAGGCARERRGQPALASGEEPDVDRRALCVRRMGIRFDIVRRGVAVDEQHLLAEADGDRRGTHDAVGADGDRRGLALTFAKDGTAAVDLAYYGDPLHIPVGLDGIIASARTARSGFPRERPARGRRTMNSGST